MALFNYDENAIIYINDQIFTMIEKKEDGFKYIKKDNGFSIHIDFGKFYDGDINVIIDEKKETIAVEISSYGVHQKVTKPVENGIEVLGGGVVGLGGVALGTLFGSLPGAIGGGVGGYVVGATPGFLLSKVDKSITKKLNEEHLKTLEEISSLFDTYLYRREDPVSFDSYMLSYVNENQDSVKIYQADITLKNGMDKVMYFNSYKKNKKYYCFYQTTKRSKNSMKIDIKDTVIVDIKKTDAYNELYKKLQVDYLESINESNKRVKPINDVLIKQARQNMSKWNVCY